MTRLATISLIALLVCLPVLGESRPDSTAATDTMAARILVQATPGDYVRDSDPPTTDWRAVFRQQDWVLRSIDKTVRRVCIGDSVRFDYPGYALVSFGPVPIDKVYRVFQCPDGEDGECHDTWAVMSWYDFFALEPSARSQEY